MKEGSASWELRRATPSYPWRQLNTTQVSTVRCHEIFGSFLRNRWENLYQGVGITLGNRWLQSLNCASPDGKLATVINAHVYTLQPNRCPVCFRDLDRRSEITKLWNPYTNKRRAEIVKQMTLIKKNMGGASVTQGVNGDLCVVKLGGLRRLDVGGEKETRTEL